MYVSCGRVLSLGCAIALTIDTHRQVIHHKREALVRHDWPSKEENVYCTGKLAREHNTLPLGIMQP